MTSDQSSRASLLKVAFNDNKKVECFQRTFFSRIVSVTETSQLRISNPRNEFFEGFASGKEECVLRKGVINPIAMSSMMRAVSGQSRYEYMQNVVQVFDK